ncbi:hypothetical protein LEP1GSC062_0153 [Leptospira alexanderi serovar Manhao 3 str. L 60]|uniref:Uncharacterized protein n=1 Tax=Leptospira alexanderi serovar Manhao 3 str. L 60 TaxID=1049759 RepID=V6HTX4_9LEPT|nr:hypothetical protein LEP1GSC062_0153 [Leptospira alexanderi serovar Manhao 3 str. L 60]
MTGAESPVSEKGKRISNIEYNRTLKYETTFLRCRTHTKGRKRAPENRNAA